MAINRLLYNLVHFLFRSAMLIGEIEWYHAS